MKEVLVKRCICERCGHIVEIKPNEECPEECSSCRDGKGGYWSLEPEERVYGLYG
jgi:hypothetical protein